MVNLIYYESLCFAMLSTSFLYFRSSGSLNSYGHITCFLHFPEHFNSVIFKFRFEFGLIYSTIAQNNELDFQPKLNCLRI